MNYLQLALAGFLTFSLGTGLGIYIAPTKTKIEEKTSEQNRTEHDRSISISEKFDSQGTVTNRRTTIRARKTKTSETTKEKKKEIEKTQKVWAVKLGVVKPLKDMESYYPRGGLEIRLPFFSSWLGIEGDFHRKNPSVTPYLRLEF